MVAWSQVVGLTMLFGGGREMEGSVGARSLDAQRKWLVTTALAPISEEPL